MTKHEQLIVKLLAKGMKQSEVHDYLNKKGIKPNSIRTIEDTVRRIKKEYRAKTSFHLACLLAKRNLI